MRVPPAKDGLHTVTPYLIVDGAARLIDYLKVVFDAEEERRTVTADGSIKYARVRIGDAIIMMADSTREQLAFSNMLYVFVDDLDRAFERALQQGSTVLREPAQQYYGDRNAGVLAPFGNQWWFAEPGESVSPDEAQRRATAPGI